MESKFLPLHNWILVEAIEDEKGLIEIVESYKKTYKAKVLSVGVGYMLPIFDASSNSVKNSDPSTPRKLIPLTVKIGDTIQFKQHVIHYIKIDGKNLMLVKEHEIDGILVDE